MNPIEPESRPPVSRERVGVVSFRELTGGLAWPLLGRSLGQSVRLVNLSIGVLFSAIVFGGAWLLDRVWVEVVQGWFGMEDWGSPFAMFSAFWPTGGRADLSLRLLGSQYAFESSGWVSGVAAVLALVILSFGLGAIARSTALALSSGRSMGVREAIGFALSRAQRLAVAVLVPSVLIGAVLLLITLVRLLLFSLDYLQPIGATLFVIPLVLGVAGAMLLALSVAGHGMLAPAVVVEHTDGIDAVQRSWGYLVARPIRFVFYAAVGLVILVGAYWLFQTICRVGIDLSSRAVPASVQEELLAEPGYAARAIAFWVQVLWLVFIGWVISFYGCASTIVYLLMRLACDEQDVTVLWHPARSEVRVSSVEQVQPEPEPDLEL